MHSPTETLPIYSAPWGRDFYRDPASPTTSDVEDGWTSPAAVEILADAFWAAKVARGLDEAKAGAGVPLADFRHSLAG